MRNVVCCGLWLFLGCTPAAAQALHTLDRILPDRPLTNLTEVAWQFGEMASGDDLVSWGAWPGIRTKQAIWLGDGSWLCGDLTITGDGSVSLRSNWLACAPIAVAQIRGLVLRPPASLAQWNDLQSRMADAAGEQDVVWLDSGRKLMGIVQWPTGSTQETTSFQLETGSQVLDLALREVQALVMSPALMGRLPGEFPGQTVGLVDGTLLRTREIHVDQHQASFTLQGAVTLVSHDAPSEFATSVRYIAKNHKLRLRWLGDMEVARYRYLPDSTLEWELGVDRDLLRRPLILNGGMVARGLATHSDSQVAFRWDGSAARLLAEVVFAQPEAGANPKLGSVDCQVLVARDGQLETAAQFEMARADNSRPKSSIIDVDLTGIQLFVLVTQASDYGQLGDHILWLNARVATSP